MPEDRDKQTARVLVDTGRCRVETHPEYGIVITGFLEAAVIDGKPVIVPRR